MVGKALVLFAGLGVVGASETEHHANPIRKVVTMLQMMQNKVTKEGEKKQEIFDKFMCYCKNADTLLGGAVTAAENKIPMLESSIGEDAAMKKQLDADVVQHKADRAAAKDEISKAQAIREKEHADFVKEKTVIEEDIASLDKAIKALHLMPGNVAGFLQTSAAQVVRQLSIEVDMSGNDREMLTSFLASKTGTANPEVIGILDKMKTDFGGDLNATVDKENAAVVALEELVEAKTKEIDTLLVSIENKIVRSGELAVKHAEMLNDLDDTREDLAESRKFLADLDGNCKNKQKEWMAYQKMQGQELVALADTIKVLNDDDALELFKKTLPGGSASLMGVSVSSMTMQKKALAMLELVHSPRVDLVEVALRGGKRGFGKIIKMIDGLTAELRRAQTDDSNKKAYCEAELDKAEDKKKVLSQNVADIETAIDDETEAINTLKTEIEALDDGIRALDKEVAEATENRQEEHEEFKATYPANAAAVDLLKFAKNRLNKFYNPSQYKAPKRHLTEEERITLNMGGTLAPTEAPGIAGTHIVVGLTQEGVPPPPDADLSYKTKGEESGGVIAMIDTLVNDVERGMQEAKLEEKDAQGDYERFMSDAKAKRAEDSKSMTDKQAALADTEESLVNNKEAHKNGQYQQMETAKFIGGLHADCDWLLKHFDLRKEARTDEIDAMNKAKDVLSGADYTL